LPAKAQRKDADERHPVRVLIVDDSAVTRAVLARMVCAQPDLDVVASAASVAEALHMLGRIEVDVVLLDVAMPGGSGLEALPTIIDRAEGAKVLIVSSSCDDGAEVTIRALRLGAADTLPKPGTGASSRRFSELLVERLRRLGPLAGHRRPRSAAAAAPEHPILLREMPDHRLGCLALGASTGGIHAQNEFLRALPPRIEAPILITQHLPASFMRYFAREVEAASGRQTRIAEDGMKIEPDVIFIAPGDSHLGVRQSGSRVEACLSRAPSYANCLPSVDAMLSSAADIYGPGLVAVIFSGMGKDGLAGSAHLVSKGGAVLVQDAASSAVWGMPRAVAEAGLASGVLTPAELGHRIAVHAGGEPWR
jgi:two-component system chemotaxis response regulator CheB